jgi:Zn-dependent protease
MTDIFRIVVQFAVVLFAISVHESAHAWVADKCGDPTARLMGRVTLNPLAHIDLIGTIIFPILLAIIGAPVFGWAKPVMVNPHNLRNRRRDGMLVSAAGPISNILVALGVILLLGIFSYPIMQSTGNSIALLIKIATYLLMINIFLAVFNLIPIPPLDGSTLLFRFLPPRMAWQIRPFLSQYGMFIVLAVVLLGGQYLSTFIFSAATFLVGL